MVENSSPLKIAFVGTLSCGKTTLLEDLRKQFIDKSDVEFVREAARDFFLENKDIVDRFSLETQRRIQELVLEREKIALSLNPRLVFCDRSVLDAVVYSRVGGQSEMSGLLLEGVRNYIPSYSRLYLLDPKDVPYIEDDIRNEGPIFREKIHHGYLELFQEASISYQLLSGSKDQRVEIVLQSLTSS